MFIQVIQGRCTRQNEMHALVDGWRSELAAGAHGWLGTTYGFTDDDTFLAVVRFDSRESAVTNSARPQQGAWAQRLAALMDGPLEFHDYEDVTVFLGGGSDQAGFVQVIQGRVADVAAAKAMVADPSALQQLRPEILGGTLAFEPDGSFTQTVAFTDEASARQGEQLEPPAEVQEQLQQAMQGARFYDLRAPRFSTAT